MESLKPNLLLVIPLAPLLAAIIAGVFCSVIPRWVARTVTILGVAVSLLVSLFVPRRRLWVKAVDGRLEYAGLARGEDPTLEAAVADLARRHRAVLGEDE